jgi:hypothetical protein
VPVTLYRVLRAQSNEEGVDPPWLTVEVSQAAGSGDAAIRAVIEEHGEGLYVAIPRRSWKPRMVKVETKTRTVLS